MSFQDDFSDEELIAGGPVTSQPQPMQQPQQPVFAMPPPSSANESTALNSSVQQSYTPGSATGNAPLVIVDLSASR